MVSVNREVDRYLVLLGNKIRAQGYTQLAVQEALGWGRSYISQLVTKQKQLRIEQVLAILNVIGIDPTEFFGELYPTGPRFAVEPSAPAGPDPALLGLRREIHGLVNLLVEKDLITLEDLSAAVSTLSHSTDGGEEPG